MRRYILNAAGDPAPCEDLLEWARWYEERDNRRVALDEVNGVRVSTVFLGLDHGWGRGAPVLWETMSFPREDTPPDDPRWKWSDYQERYTSAADARAGHARVVEAVRRGEPPPEGD
jgi:hypothetical protein